MRARSAFDVAPPDGSLRSKILPVLPEGTVVTTSRNDVQYVVTEFGVAQLRGKSARERARALLDAVGLAQAMDKRPGELSGGMQQRVAIARALVNNPPLVLADEPTGNLDTASTDAVFGLLRQIHEERGTAFIVVTHDPRLAQRCDRIVELVDGRIARDERVPPGAGQRG